MTKDFETLIELLKCSAKDIPFNEEMEVNIPIIYDLAVKQGVWPLVLPVIKKLVESGVVEGDITKINEAENSVLFAVARHMSAKDMLSELLKKLEEENIDAVLLKGDTLAELYSTPEYRISGDTDLFIDEKDEAKAIRILSEFGFDIEKRFNTEHDSKCRHPVIGLVELHVALYDDYCEDIWFSGLETRMEPLTVLHTHDGYEYKVLGINDQLIYNTMHLIKHFLSSGAGIRQIMDVLLFIEHYKENIDIERYCRTIKALSFDKFMDACMAIGMKYMGFERDKLIFINNSRPDHQMAEKILTDIEMTGMFGANDVRLRDFAKLYTEKRYAERIEGDYNEYLKARNAKNSVFSKLFLAPGKLAEKYPYVKKSKLLVPIAWMHRIINALFKRTKKKTYDASGDLFSAKLKLLRDMDMV